MGYIKAIAKQSPLHHSEVYGDKGENGASAPLGSVSRGPADGGICGTEGAFLRGDSDQCREHMWGTL